MRYVLKYLFTDETVTSQNSSREYQENQDGYVLMPEEYGCDRQYPVLYLFHGSGGYAEWNNLGQGDIVNNINKWSDTYKFSPMIIIMPQIGKGYKKLTPEAFKQFTPQFGGLMQRVKDVYGNTISSEKRHTAIAGFSLGGATALYCSYYYKDKFIHTGAFSPSSFLSEWIGSGNHLTLENDNETINFIGYGSDEYEFKTASIRYIEDLRAQNIKINTNGMSQQVLNGGHNFYTFNTLLERFLKVDIFSYVNKIGD